MSDLQKNEIERLRAALEKIASVSNVAGFTIAPDRSAEYIAGICADTLAVELLPEDESVV